MKTAQHHSTPSKSTRREFVKTTAAGLALGAAASQLNVARAAFAGGSDTIRIALIGCGGRGTGAASQALSTEGPVKLVALADVFRHRIDRSLQSLQHIKECEGRIDVPEERKFTGFDAFQKAIDCGVDLVLLATPPHFRPQQYEAAIKAGKHVFMEKPYAVDGPGYRKLLEVNQIAKSKGLAVGVGLQRHHQQNYNEWMEQIHNGAIGEVQYVRTYFNMSGGITGPVRRTDETEMEYQIRNWNMFTWLSGDHIVEQAVHSIDIAAWALRVPPLRANGMGGREVRVGKGTGHIFDHHFVEFEYPNEVRYYCQARQIPGTWLHVSESVHGTKGSLVLGVGPYGGTRQKGYRGNNPYQQEHDDLFASIRRGKPLFEGDYAALASMTAVLGRMATYSGNVVEWEDAIHSTLKLAPENYAYDAEPPVLPLPDGSYPVAVPGTTKAV